MSRRGTFIDVDHDTYFTVFDDDLVSLTPCADLPASVTRLLSSSIERVLDHPVMTLGVWQGDPNRPDVLALAADGTLIAVLTISTENLETVPQTLLTIDSWLEHKKLRDLSDLSDDPSSFYEGLWDLSPEASITLNDKRRYVLVTSADHLDVHDWSAGLGDSTIEIQYFDVFEMPGNGAPILKRRTPTPDDRARAKTAIGPLAEVIDLATQEHDAGVPADPASGRSFSFGDSISGDDTRMISTSDAIDLRAPDPTPVSPIDASVLSPTPRIRPGATFALDRLPLLFDPLGANLTSISDELFAVDQHLVLVEKLPERRRETPFEDRSRFRWDSSVEQITLLAKHTLGPTREPRTTHLFVETERQSGYCLYIGELVQIDTHRSSNDVAWFSITPPLDVDLYRMLRKGRLPEHIDSPTVDFGTLDS